MKNIKKISIRTNNSGFEALRALEEGGCQIVLVLDDKNKLVGTISDGDVRRTLINGKSLDILASEIMCKKFIFVKEKEKNKNILELMKENLINQIPILKENGEVSELVLLQELIPSSKTIINRVLIMAGGIGSRLRPYTENCPKPMLKVGDKPILEILLEQLIEAGFKNFYFSVNYLKEKIINHFQNGEKWNVNITYLIEKEPLGTAGSLSLLNEEFNEPFIVMNGDILTKFNLNRLIKFHNMNNSFATLCVREHEIKIPFGVIESNGLEFKKILEKPTYRKFVNAGVYTFDPSVIKYISKGKKMDMPELFVKLKDLSKKVLVCPIHEYWIDIGRHETLKEADKSWLN